MNKLYLSSALLAIFALPSFADIGKTASTATCDSATIGATSGTAYMDTAWTANTINLDFYSDGEKISTGSCTYDGAIELPEDPEDKTGYTFGGWKVRATATQTTFDLSTWNYGTVPRGDSAHFQFISIDGKRSQGITTGLINGEWRMIFGNGTVKFESLCASNGGTEGKTGTPQGNNGQYCWCRATGVDTTGSGTYIPVSSPLWVFDFDFDTAKDCANNCVEDCETQVQLEASFRSAIFGQ